MQSLTESLKAELEIVEKKANDAYVFQLLDLLVNAFFARICRDIKSNSTASMRFSELESGANGILTNEKASLSEINTALLSFISEHRGAVSFHVPCGSDAVGYLERFCKQIALRDDFKTVAESFGKIYWHLSY